MKSRELIISLIVLLLILIVGLIAFLVFALNGNFKFKNWGTKKRETVIFDESYDFAEIEKMEILSSAGDIKFIESMDDKIRVVVYGENAEDLTVDLKEHELRVDSSKYKHKKIFFGFDFHLNDIIVYIPKNYEKEIDINAKYGDIEMLDLENATVRIEEDCGDVSLGKVKNAFVSNHYGDIEIAEIGNKVEIQSDCGDVKIDAINIMENSLVENNLGDIKIGKTNEIYIDAKTDLGDVKVNNNYRHSEITLKIENDCGDIKVEN